MIGIIDIIDIEIVVGVRVAVEVEIETVVAVRENIDAPMIEIPNTSKHQHPLIQSHIASTNRLNDHRHHSHINIA